MVPRAGAVLAGSPARAARPRAQVGRGEVQLRPGGNHSLRRRRPEAARRSVVRLASALCP